MRQSIAIFLRLALVGVFLSVALNATLAQVSNQLNSKALLRKEVSLKLGETTLNRVLVEISTQTGAKVRCDDYLSDHRLMIFLDKISANSVLNLIADMNEWRWIILDNGEAVVTHRQVIAPQSMKEMPPMLRRALPREFRRFLGEETTLEDVIDESDKRALELLSSGDIGNRNEYRKFLMDSKASSAVNKKIGGLPGSLSYLSTLFPDIPNEANSSVNYRFTDWRRPLRESVLLSILYGFLRPINDQSVQEALQGRLRPYVADPTIAKLYFRDKRHPEFASFMITGPDFDIDGSPIESYMGHTLDYLQKDLPDEWELRAKP